MRKLTLALALVSTAGAIAFAPASIGAANLAAPIRLEQVATGVDHPVAFAWRNGRASPIYVAEQSGSLVTVAHGHVTSTLLTVSVSHGNEEGLLGIAFSHDGTKLYIDYTDPKGDIHIVEYTMNGNLVNKNTRRQLMMIPHHSADNHNGGNLVIGPDNMLYIGVGDGGGGGDTFHNGQNKTSLLAKILRINPKKNGSHPFTIPKDNPWANKPYTKAMWMWGLRNPWRFSIDRKTHDMWIGDVGQDAWEEIDYAKAGQKGINWGWPLREGKHPYNGGARPPGARDPIFERSHSDGDCAIIGGYVYRGSAIPGFQGAYVFGDECTGEIRAITQSGGHLAQSRDLNLNVSQLSSFGEGPKGEIYAASLGGTLYVLAPK